MFRLGGGVIKGKQVGNRENFQDPTPTYDSLIKEILTIMVKVDKELKIMVRN